MPRLSARIFACDVRVDRLRDARIAVAQLFLPHLQRCAESVHHRCVGVPEGMETVALRNLHPQLFEKRFEFPFELKIRVPGRAVLCCKEQPPFARSPSVEEAEQMLARLSPSIKRRSGRYSQYVNWPLTRPGGVTLLRPIPLLSPFISNIKRFGMEKYELQPTV